MGTSIILYSPDEVVNYIVAGKKRIEKAIKELTKNGMWRTHIAKVQVTFYVEPFNG